MKPCSPSASWRAYLHYTALTPVSNNVSMVIEHLLGPTAVLRGPYLKNVFKVTRFPAYALQRTPLSVAQQPNDHPPPRAPRHSNASVSSSTIQNPSTSPSILNAPRTSPAVNSSHQLLQVKFQQSKLFGLQSKLVANNYSERLPNRQAISNVLRTHSLPTRHGLGSSPAVYTVCNNS